MIKLEENSVRITCEINLWLLTILYGSGLRAGSQPVFKYFLFAFWLVFDGNFACVGDVRPGNGHVGRIAFADQLSVFVIPFFPLNAYGGSFLSLSFLPVRTGPAQSLWENAVFYLQSSVHVFVGRAYAGFYEGFLKIIREESVQDGVDGRIGVAQKVRYHVAQQKERYPLLFGAIQPFLLVVRRLENEY